MDVPPAAADYFKMLHDALYLQQNVSDKNPLGKASLIQRGTSAIAESVASKCVNQSYF